MISTQSLYLIIVISSISIPIIYSFLHTHFRKKIKYILLASVIVMIPFIVWDIYFTQLGIWGFNEMYHLPYKIFGLPLEEWLFFICIPFACIFTHEALLYYIPRWKFNEPTTLLISKVMIAILLIILYCNVTKQYTLVNFSLLLFVLLISMKYFLKDLQTFFPSFLVILLPFLIVNGLLTGSLIENEIVWYNNNENLNFRIGTIPIEDFGYAFLLLFLNLIVFKKLVVFL